MSKSVQEQFRATASTSISTFWANHWGHVRSQSHQNTSHSTLISSDIKRDQQVRNKKTVPWHVHRGYQAFIPVKQACNEGGRKKFREISM